MSIISQTARPRRPVPVRELAEHCAHFHDNNNALFNDEFKVRLSHSLIKIRTKTLTVTQLMSFDSVLDYLTKRNS